MDAKPPPDTKLVSLPPRPDEGPAVVSVQSTLPRDLTCPYCGGVRRPDGWRVVRYRDVPVDGISKCVDWRRQLYRCRECGRASKEDHPAFEREHFVTHRFADWVRAKSATSSFAEIAKLAGMNHVLLRRIFHALSADATANRPNRPKVLGIATVRLAGVDRPVLIDVSKRQILQILRSNEALLPALQEFASLPGSCKVSRVVRDAQFGRPEIMTALRVMFPEHQAIVTTRSLAQKAVDLMTMNCQALFKTVAEEEEKSPRSVRNLFVRMDLKKSALRRLGSWDSPEKRNGQLLLRAYRLKNEFWRIWVDDRDLMRWRDWVSAASSVSELGFNAVVDLMESNRDLIQPCFEDIELYVYESRLDEIRKFEPNGTQSFAAAKMALLTKFGGRDFGPVTGPDTNVRGGGRS